MDKKPTTVAECDALIAEFELRQHQLEERMGDLPHLRREVSLRAMLGEPDAAAELEKLAAEESAFLDNMKTLRDAIDGVHRLRAIYVPQEASEEKKQRVLRAEKLIARLHAVSARADKRLQDWIDDLKEREAIGRELVANGLHNDRTTAQLSPGNLSVIVGAIQATGFTFGGTVAVPISRTLLDSDRESVRLGGEDERLLAHIKATSKRSAA
ncbi:hypothetical protein SLNSH_17000 [Alsobacter soli]|uniref:Uncharacterized protein n=1 Tax=Alsobacter soli TaxID=2109933 RepID=A0A2T1HQA6_9HYPH|nr:hypothetical protein [Alsobacter soli]PSC03807.1 hypothetical protein SLNSH_17000 [Alsobacter soli]